MKLSEDYKCSEKHIGITPRSIMTKGTSTRRKNRLNGSLYGNFDPGDQDKLMITYERDPEHDYTLNGACGVLYQGNIHFFGGDYTSLPNNYAFERQHFSIETQRKGRIVKMTKLKNLNIDFQYPSCSNFEITSDYFPWSSKNIVILCFKLDKPKSCYSYDGKLNYIGDSNFGHNGDGLAKYRGKLITVGGDGVSVKTEIMERKKNGSYIWSKAESDGILSQYKYMVGKSLVTIPSSDINEEYVLLIGGVARSKLISILFDNLISSKVFKFNGTWYNFGKLKKTRKNHNSIYWNGAVYIIGGNYDNSNFDEDIETKIEIWKINDSPDQFMTSENWPLLHDWKLPYLFIVPDAFFPDY